MNRVVVFFGFDNLNTVGLIHSFKKTEFYVVGLLWGKKTGFVSACNYVSEILAASSPLDCMKLLANHFQKIQETIVIIPSCDAAAVALEEYKYLLPLNFVYQNALGIYSIRDLQDKSLQVKLAQQAGFNVPLSWQLAPDGSIPDNVVYPCIIKPLASYEGSKLDLRICYNSEELKANLKRVMAPEVLIQQYIEKDNDYIIIGCGLKDGTVYMPYCNKKLSIFPKNVGLASVVKVLPSPGEIMKATESLIKSIEYNGLFSVEFMFCKSTGKYYFIECNLRNDGCNDFILKAGCNIPLLYYRDLVDGLDRNELSKTCESGQYIWEMHHFQAFLNKDISLLKWLKDIITCDGFLSYVSDDRWPFLKQFIDMLKIKLRIYKHEMY